MNRLIFTIFLLLVVKLSIGQERVYNSDKTFSIIPIEEWINYSKGNEIVFFHKLTSFRDIYQESIQIKTYPADSITLDELWNSFIMSDLTKSFKNYKSKQTGKSNINGKNANWTEFTNTAYGHKLFNLVYMLVENNIIYHIVCISLEKDYKSVENDFKKMINSLKIE